MGAGPWRDTSIGCLTHAPLIGLGNLQNVVHALYWESNPQHFGQQANALTTEKTGKGYFFLTSSGEGFLSMAAFTLPRNTHDNDAHPCPKISVGVA